MTKRSVTSADVSGKRVLTRVDFNVPIKDGVVQDDTRIRAALPTIDWLRQHGARVILVSHLGRPKGKVVDDLRLAPVAARLSELIGAPVASATDLVGEDAQAKVAALKGGDVLLLENSRFEPGEEKTEAEK